MTAMRAKPGGGVVVNGFVRRRRHFVLPCMCVCSLLLSPLWPSNNRMCTLVYYTFLCRMVLHVGQSMCVCSHLRIISKDSGQQQQAGPGAFSLSLSGHGANILLAANDL